MCRRLPLTRRSSEIKDNPKVAKQLEIIDREIQVAEKIVNDLANIVKPTDLDIAPADVQQQMIQSERLAEIGIMSAGIAHEVNNPLSVMLGKAEMILEEDDPAHIKGVRTVATVEFTKGIVVVLAGLGVFSMRRMDIWGIAESFLEF